MECPYKKECATVMYRAEEEAGFIKEVCDTDEYVDCLHYFGSLKPQYSERKRLYGNPHANEPDWDMLASEKDCRLYGKKIPNKAPVCNGNCDYCPIEVVSKIG